MGDGEKLCSDQWAGWRRTEEGRNEISNDERALDTDDGKVVKFEV